jgi:hypothetical protein
MQLDRAFREDLLAARVEQVDPACAAGHGHEGNAEVGRS